MMTSVDHRTASYTIEATADADMEIALVSETGAGAPSLDGTWDTDGDCGTLPTFNVIGNDHTYDFCAFATLGAGETIVVPGSAGGKVDFFFRDLGMAVFHYAPLIA